MMTMMIITTAIILHTSILGAVQDGLLVRIYRPGWRSWACTGALPET
jgi:hypothetical protein